MDTLVIGIDGGDEEIISTLDSGFLSEFIDQNGTQNIEEDLWNRGWGSILSGQHGRTSGGFYEKPKLDGTHDFEQTFGTRDYEQNESLTPLWERLNDEGLEVGFMNVKTTMPAPEVDGFFVSGAGGGFKPSGGVPEAACHPTSIHNELTQSDYNWEIRFLDSGIKDIFKYIDVVKETIINRTEAYLRLCREFEPDFGFLCHTETVGIQNLAMAEIQPIIDSSPEEYNEIQSSIVELYRLVSGCVERVVDELTPDRILLVSDHGQAPYLHSVNVDPFLQRIGVQPTVGEAEQKSRTLIRQVGERMPQPVIQFASSLAPSLRDKAIRSDVNWEKTMAFGHRYVPGIYINDDRFSGPVDDNSYDEIVDQIVAEFNESDEADEYNMVASRYRSKHLETKQSDLLPDIWIDKPDTMFFEGEGEFVQRNSSYRSLADQDLDQVQTNMHTGKKGSKPLLSYDFEEPSFVSDSSSDLTLAYDLILDAALH